MNISPVKSAVLASVLTAGLVATGAVGAWSLPGSWFHHDGSTQPAATPPAPPPVISYAPGSAPNYRAIVAAYGPAVVGVTVNGMHKVSAEEGGQQVMPFPFGPDDPFFRFFRGLPDFQFRGEPNAGVPFRGQGSGFIISPDGLILTNAHVVRDAKEVTVKLNDRREFPAKVLGADPDTDIAVLRIQAKDLPTIKVGDPSQLQVGDYVLAIGSPFGFDESATQGIVSAKGRSLPGDNYVPFIQTDAAVNPGNSGGPLFNAQGQVVGINAQIYSQTGGYQGLSFAIPVDVALKVKDQILRSGHATHARLGVQIQDLNQGLAQSFGLSTPDGALIAQVTPGSPAAAAGLKSGDIVTAVDGKPIRRAGDLSNRIGMSDPGDRVKLQIWRDHATKTIEAKLGDAKDTNVASVSGDGGGHYSLGLQLRPLTPQERQESRLAHGLVVEGVDGASARAGLQPGDVVLAINGKPVDDVQQIRDVLSKKPQSVALLVQHNGEQIFVPVDLG